jgi:glycosidase
MQDFVFGGIEADEGKLLANERQRWQGIRHEYRQDPRHVRPGQAVTLTVTVGQNAPVDHLAAYVTTDSALPDGERGQASQGFAVHFQRRDPLWQPLIWDYVDVWQATLPPQPQGTLVHYRIQGWQAGNDALHWSREMHLDGSRELPTLYGYHVDNWSPPEWARQAVIYQIFPDRFARGPQGEAVHRGWLTQEEMNRFMGGDLAGITARLDYIRDLGATAIWLTPIFLAHAYHAYDTIDYFEIDPRFGSKADLARLVQAAHDRGIRVILDFVANHTSSRSPLFRQAQADPHSPYREWFNFHPSYKHGYRCFFDVAAMPQFDLDHPAARAYLCEAAQYWLREFGIDGYRLDYAAGPSHSFWAAFRAACKGVDPECWLVGEVTRTGDLLRSYAGRLDGCLDFGFTRTVRRLCSEDESFSLSRAAAHLERANRFFPDEFMRPSFLDNHDMNRFLFFCAAGQEEASWGDGEEAAREVSQEARQRLKLGLTLLMALGQTPILYYGTEVGLSQPQAKGPHREESRHPMLWGGDQDGELLTFTQALIRLRRTHPALARGELATLNLDETRRTWLAVRRLGQEEVWLAINGGGEPAILSLPPGLYVDLLNGEKAEGSVELTGFTARILAGEGAR